MVRNNKRHQRVMKRDFKQPRANEWDQDRRKPNAGGDGYEAPVTSNAAFEEYYKQQRIVPEGEWDDFLACLRTPLPTTFRINGTGKFATELRDKLDTDFFAKLRQGPSEIDGEKLEEPRAIPWYPNKLAWQFTYSRTQLRRLKPLSDVHELLKRENTAGGITRQEAVSMAPPLFLDIQSHHKILDTCAAPGSKTAQMLEMLHEGAEVPTGFVIANDLEPSRCNLLVHQTKRMNSPALIVTNHDASTLPLIAGPDDSRREAMQFDRILCDVPCSGDGTIRKAPDIWRRWNVANGTGLHPLQVRITLHTAGLLKVGGRMVYSTCSFNPVEDEAVVAEVLRQSKGALQLIDVSNHMPNFPRISGLHSWSLKCKGTFVTDYSEAEEANPHNNLSPSMFPPPTAADAKTLGLERCMRVLPHHGDTGGFFIAVFEKTADMPQWQPERWQKTKEKTQEFRRRQRHLESVSGDGTKTLAPNPDSASNPPPRAGLTKIEDPQPWTEPDESAPKPGTSIKQGQPQAPQELKAGRNTAEESEGGTAASEEAGRPFGSAMEGMADDAAQAAVVFADAVADEDVPAATDAAEDAAEAAEDVAAEAEMRAPPSAAADEPSTGSVSGGETLESTALFGDATMSNANGDTTMSAAPQSSPQPDTSSRPETRGPGGSRTGSALASGGPSKAQPESAPGPREKQQRRTRPGEEPLAFFPNSPVLDSVVEFYGIPDSFPLRRQMVMRSGTGTRVGARKLYFVSSGVREVLEKDEKRALKITSAGLKIFERNDKKDPRAGSCPYRISQDGLGLLLPNITKQILRPTAAEILRLLKERYLALPLPLRLDDDKAPADAPEPEAEPEPESGAERSAKRVRTKSPTQSGEAPAEEGEPPAREAPIQEGDRIEPKGEARKIPISDLDTLAQLEGIKGGCAVCMLRDDEAKQLGLQPTAQPSGVIGAEPIALVCWRGRASISILVDKNDAASMAEKLEAAIQAFAAAHRPNSAAG